MPNPTEALQLLNQPLLNTLLAMQPTAQQKQITTGYNARKGYSLGADAQGLKSGQAINQGALLFNLPNIFTERAGI